VIRGFQMGLNVILWGMYILDVVMAFTYFPNPSAFAPSHGHDLALRDLNPLFPCHYLNSNPES
jgi:hypothetical protein